MKKSKKVSIGILGLWHLGCVYAASLASKGYEIVGFDFDKKLVGDLAKNIPPIYEPILGSLIKKHNGKNLHFINSEREALGNKDYIFVTFDVPINDLDILQMQVINKTFTLLPKYIKSETTIVISSQVPVGTSRKLVNTLKKHGIKIPRVIYFPENLRLGQAFSSFLTPDRIILGSDNQSALADFKKDFSLFECPVIEMSLESAEMVKHALNSYLATCISFSSEISDLSEKVGANMLDVVKALKTDKRVSPFAPINPGLGFAGGTLGRDIQSLKMIAKTKKYNTKLLNAVYSVNKDRLSRLLDKIKFIYPNLKGKNIGLLGLTYTKNTNTLRRSMSLELAKKLRENKCYIHAFDPAIKTKISSYTYIKVNQNLKDFFKGLDLIILMTDWPQFQQPKLLALSKLMRKKTVVDTKNFLNANLYKKNGFTYLGMGVS